MAPFLRPLFRVLPVAAMVARLSASEPLPLWPGLAPGEDAASPAETSETSNGVTRVGHVSKPTLTLFPAPADHNTGTSVIVCPGGGYNILAWDLEGNEICQWLNSIGVNGLLLKYRVPATHGRPRHAAALQDVQRAIGLTRQHATEWKIDPNRLGVLGFSAGGHLSAAASTNFETRTYPAIDEADKLSARPDFTVLVYPAYLTDKDITKTVPEITVTNKTPPAFIVMTQDDPVGVQNAVAYSLALKNAKVPCELHLFAVGGHGYGLRPKGNPVTGWPKLAEAWLRDRKLINP